MMDECEDSGTVASGANPFDEADEKEVVKTEGSTPTTNPFELDEVEASLPQNPFDNEDEVEKNESEVENNKDYEYVSLTAPVVEVNKMHNGDWDSEWEHVSAAVKNNYSSISVVAPEVISSMMSK